MPYALAGFLAFLILAVACFHFAPPTEIRPAKTTITEKPVVAEKRLPNLFIEIPLKTGTPLALTFFDRYGRFIRLAVSLAAPLICLFYMLYRIGRKRPALTRGGGKPPPYYLPIRTDRQRPGYLTRRRFFDAVNRLRVRIRSEVFRLDTDRTIWETIQKGGFPELRYRAVTRPAEYLFLVDLKAADDHYAHFMGTTAVALTNEGIFADVWYFSEDPRICFKHPGGAGVRLDDLRTKYADRRLAVVGECDAFLNPMTGRPDEWAGMFSTWRDRAILTPRRPRNWGMREVALASRFIVLPATLAINNCSNFLNRNLTLNRNLVWD